MQTRSQARITVVAKKTDAITEEDNIARFLDSLLRANSGQNTRQITACAIALAKINQILNDRNTVPPGSQTRYIIDAYKIINATPDLFASSNAVVCRTRAAFLQNGRRLIAECLHMAENETIKELYSEISITLKYGRDCNIANKHRSKQTP